jgi:hypothetical protein
MWKVWLDADGDALSCHPPPTHTHTQASFRQWQVERSVPKLEAAAAAAAAARDAVAVEEEEQVGLCWGGRCMQCAQVELKRAVGVDLAPVWFVSGIKYNLVVSLNHKPG